MKKGSERGQVVIEIHVVERGTFVLNKLWFGSNSVSPYWFGADVSERNLLGLGIAVGGGLIYAAHGDVGGDRDQWAGELRAADTSLYGSRWGANGSLTLVHGSEPYRISGTAGDDATDFRAFPYRRFGGRAGVTYDVDRAVADLVGLRAEQVDTELPVAPTRTLADGRVVDVDLHLEPGESRIVTAGFGFDRDTRPDPILPHSGGKITASVSRSARRPSAAATTSRRCSRATSTGGRCATSASAIGLRLAGGVVIGDAPRFDRIHISDVDHMLTPRALGLVLSNAQPLDILGTRPDKPTLRRDRRQRDARVRERAVPRHRQQPCLRRRLVRRRRAVGRSRETDELRLRDSGVWKRCRSTSTPMPASASTPTSACSS